MKNPFNLSDEKLKKMLDGYFVWSNKSEDQRKYPGIEKRKSEDIKNTLLNEDYLSGLSDEKLIDIIVEYANKLEGPVKIKINKPKITKEIGNIRSNLLYVINSQDIPFKKASYLLSSGNKIKDFSRSFWTPILRSKYPESAPNWNKKPEDFLKKLGINITTSKKTTEEKYKAFSDAYLYLKGLDDRYDFFTLDHLTHYGIATKEGALLMDNLMFDFDEWVNLDSTRNAIREYAEIRNRKDPELWDEDYKWDVLPKVNSEFFKESMTIDNIVKKISILNKYNPSSGSFVHFGNLLDLKEIATLKPEIVIKSLESLFNGEAILCERIDEFIKELKKIKKDASLGTPLFGYLLAMYDYKKYSLYKDSVFKKLKKNIAKEKEWKSDTIGMKCQRFQELCLKMGNYLKDSNLLKNVKTNKFEVPVGITALDGQDFFYYFARDNIRYWRIVEPLEEKVVGRSLWPVCKEKGIIAIGFQDSPNAQDVKNMRDKMNIGDKVIAYLLDKRVGGIGTVIGEYEDYSKSMPKEKDFFDGRFWFRRKIKWERLPKHGNFWKLVNAPSGVHQTVFQLKKEEYEKILKEIDSDSNSKKPDPIPIITKEELLKHIFVDEDKFEQISCLLENCKKKQIIFQGPPGTGKTFVAQKIALFLTQSEDRIETIQFHPSYSYEDFIEGYRPKNGKFELEDGIFKVFCEKARENKDKKYILIIDEINRGNLSKIFGELLYLLEYRDKEVKLTYSKEKFCIPENVYLIGTMNTADRSLAIMDYALRRRFYFVDVECKTKRLKKWLDENSCSLNTDELIGSIENMNNRIKDEMHSKDFAIGHSYFMREELNEDKLREILKYGVKPLLNEYFFDKDGKVGEIVGIMEKVLNKEKVKAQEQ